MKKIAFMFVFIFLVVETFSMLFAEEKHIQNTKMIDIGQTDNSTKIVISTGGKKPEQVYQRLKYFLDIYKGNIYCTKIINKYDKSVRVKYIYFSNPQLFDGLVLDEGRFFNLVERESDKFLSTEKTGDKNQIGIIGSFAKQQYFEIRTMKTALDYNFFDRSFYIELTNKNDLDSFINDLQNNNIYIIKQNSIAAARDPLSIFIVVIFVCFLILMLLLLYDLLNSYKNIAIEKMLGNSNYQIWKKRIIPLIFIEFFITVSTTSILVFFNFKVYNHQFFVFLNKLFLFYGLIIIFTLVFLSLPFIYVKKIKIIDMLKNKRPVKAIINFNIFIKTMFIIVLIVMLSKSYLKYNLIFEGYNGSYKNWQSVKEYAVIPSFSSLPGSDKGDMYTIENEKKEKELFLFFNKKGAIYADFENYSPLQRKYNKADPVRDFIIVNPNYLKSNHVIDEKGKQIEIGENETDYILLVPEKYRAYENDIKKYHQLNKTGRSNKNHGDHKDRDEHHDKVNDEKPESIVAKQKIKIIWTKSNQKLFSYRLDINPQNGNCVTDPIVKVITEANGDLIDYFVILGYMGNPFKFKVSDTSDPSSEILPQLGKYYDLDIHPFTVVSVFDSVEDEIRKIEEQLLFSVIAVILLLFIIILIIFQNVYNFFEQYKMRIAIQKFHGYKSLDKYNSYFLTVILSWLIAYPVSLLITGNKNILLLAVCLLALEILLSFLLLQFNERRNILAITKGG